MFDHDGNLYVSHGRFLTRMTPQGETTIWAETAGANGHKVLGDGTHLVCDRVQHAVLHLSADGQFLENAASDWPNDLTLDQSGGFYFTDPGPYTEAATRAIGRVCYVDARRETFLVADELHFPNGIVLRANGRALLVAEDSRNRILEYPVLSPGQLGPAKVFADLPSNEGAGPDGLALDEKGNLYIAHYGAAQILVVDPMGRRLRSLPAGNVSVSDLAFGGKDMNELYMTGSAGGFDEPGVVYRLKLENIRGLVVLPPRKESIR